MSIKSQYNEIMFNFLSWRLKNISDRNFMILLGSIVGVIAGLAAVTLKVSVHFIERFLITGLDIPFSNYLYLAYPMIGIIITTLLAKYVLRENLGHGITQILSDISTRFGIVKRTRMYSRIITSAITVGFGGSVGLEAPIVVTGSAIGSNISLLGHLDQRKRNVMIGCGAAGAISAIFNSPIAGVIFCMEVILAEVRISTFIPLLIASVCGSLVSLTLLGDDVLFSFTLVDQFTASETPYYILLGIVCGLISVYFTRLTYVVEGAIHKLKGIMSKAVIGGLLLGLIIFVFPPIYGEGYSAIKVLLSNRADSLLDTTIFGEASSQYMIILFLIGVTLIKPVASALTIGAGGSGGIFAPSLFIGALGGYSFATIVNQLMGQTLISPSNFTLVGMCGALSGILHAPLTAIFLIAEITSGYELIVPLMLVSAIAYSTSLFFEKNSIYTKKLIEKGELIVHDKDRQVLSQINLAKIVEKDLLTIRPDATLGELVNLVKRSKRNIFPVVSEAKELVGIVTLDHIRDIMFDVEAQHNRKVSSLMSLPPAYISTHENMQSVMHKFELTNAWNLPVIDEGQYVGFISKSRIFNTYRTKLIRQQKE